MKRILAIAIIAIMGFSMVGATYADTDKRDVESSEIMKFSLEEAIDYALEHNRDMKIQDINIEKADLGYDETRYGIRKYNSMPDKTQYSIKVDDTGETEVTIEELGKDNIEAIQRKLNDLGVTKRSAQLGVDIAKWNKDIKINQIKYDVEKAYYDLQQIKNQYDIAKEGLNLARTIYDQSKVMFDVGTISEQQLLASEVSLAQAESGLEEARKYYELQKMSFNNTLGLDLTTDIELTSQLTYEPHDYIKVEEGVKEALEKNAGLKVVKENYELSKLSLEATKIKYTPNTFRYKEKELGIQEAAKSLDTVKIGVEMGVRSAYLSLDTAEKQIKTYQKASDKAKKSYDISQLRYKVGEGTLNDVTKARIDYMNAKKELNNKIHAYNLALLDYRYSKGLGKNVIG